MTLTLLLIFAPFFGLLFGSFASVILLRWKEAKSWSEAGSILRGRSECPQCHHQLGSWDLVPVFSYLWNRGKCHYCQHPVSRFYLFLELSSAVIFTLVSIISFSQGIALVLFRVLSAWGIWLLFIYDIRYYELHLPILIFLLLLLIIPAVQLGLGRSTFLFLGIWTLIFIGIYFLGRWMVRWKYQIKGEGFGLGDVMVAPYLAVLLSFFFPQAGVQEVFLLLMLFLVIAGILALLHYLIQIKLFNSTARDLDPELAPQALPFLPAMLVAGLLLIFWGEGFLAQMLVF